MVKMKRIFISSTFRDLKNVRTKVKDAVLELGHYPAGMELFGARSDDQWKIIENEINNSDYYVVIIGECFGTFVPGEDISYTQKEFHYAKNIGIPILGFIASENAVLEMADTELEKIEKLKRFKQEVETGRTVAYWSDADNIATKVICSLIKEIYGIPSGLEKKNNYGNGIILRDGWNFHNDIAMRLEYKARNIYKDFDRPFDKKYDADGIESGGYFAEVMIDILREQTKKSNNSKDIDQFIKDLAPYIQKTGYEISRETAQGLLNHFLGLMENDE